MRAVAVERPINIVYGGVPYAVMMATPADLEDFVIGFSLTEGVIVAADDIRALRQEEQPDGVRLHVDLAPERLHAMLARRRAMAGRTGCGVCGIDDIAALPRANRPLAQPGAIEADAIRRALAGLERNQPLNDRTRAVHGAAWANLAGAVVCVREDVGRHNALDKLIGALVRTGVDAADGFAVVTSRCSYEMVEKTAAFGAACLVAISAPTSLAIERAAAHRMTLVAVARADAFTVFAGVDGVGLREGVPA